MDVGEADLLQDARLYAGDVVDFCKEVEAGDVDLDVVAVQRAIHDVKCARTYLNRLLKMVKG